MFWNEVMSYFVAKDMNRFIFVLCTFFFVLVCVWLKENYQIIIEHKT